MYGSEPRSSTSTTWSTSRAIPTKVKLTTTAVDSSYDDGGDLPEFAHTVIHAHTIWLTGEEAELFLRALPTCTPQPDDDEPDINDSFPVELEYDDHRF